MSVVPTNSDRFASRQRHCVSGSGTGDAAAVVRAEDQRSGLLDLLPVRAVEHVRVAVLRGIELGHPQLREIAAGTIKSTLQCEVLIVKFSCGDFL